MPAAAAPRWCQGVSWCGRCACLWLGLDCVTGEWEIAVLVRNFLNWIMLDLTELASAPKPTLPNLMGSAVGTLTDEDRM